MPDAPYDAGTATAADAWCGYTLRFLAIALAMPKNNGNWILSVVPFTLALAIVLVIAIPKSGFLAIAVPY